MYEKICARNSDNISYLFYTFSTTVRRLVFFIAFVFIPFSPLCIVSDSLAAEIPSAAISAHSATDLPDTAMMLVTANLPLKKATTQIVVTISINRESKGDFFVELDNDGELYVRVEDLVNLKLNISADRAVFIHNEKYAPLSALRDVSYIFDDKNLSVSIVGRTMEKQKTIIDLYPLQSSPKDVYYPHESSAFLNYGITYAYANPFGFQSISAANKLGVRAGDVFFVSDFLYTKTANREQFIRLASNATYERRNDFQWLVLGDQFANSGELGSSVNMGGIGFSKVYKLDPYFIKQPLFNIQGVTVFPSEAEIYMDGVLVGKQPIVPGSFDLRNIYMNAGSHRIDMVLKDPFGNEQKISYPLYSSPLLLREGLHEYSYDAGFMRKQYGVASNEYGKPVFSAYHRYGVTSSLNIGARAEGFDDIYNGGVTASFLIPRAGAFVLSFAASNANKKSGSAVSLQHSYQLGNFDTSLLMRAYSRNYATVNTTSFFDNTRYAVILGAGYSLARAGGISLGYSGSKTYNGTNTRVTSASYSKGFSRAISLYVTASSTRIVDTTYSLFVGLSINFETNYHGSVQYSTTGSSNMETIQIQKDQPIGEGLGYQASLNRSETGSSSIYSFNPSLQYNARYGIYSANSSIQSTDGTPTESYTFSAAGALVYTSGFYGFSRPVNDSFGIVMVADLPHAKIFNNGSEIGETDRSGMMIVPSLVSYNQNLITVDLKDIPMDYSISGVNEKISPSLWSGSCIAFDARKVRAVTGTLYVMKADKKIPLEYVDISIKAGNREVTSPTGKDGEFYIENTLPADQNVGTYDKQSCRAIADRRKSGGTEMQPGTYQASVDYEGEKCEFFVTFPATEDVITDLGEVRCLLP